MPAPGKRQDLLFKFIKPGRIQRKMDGAGLNRCGLSGHAHDFVAIRIDADGIEVLAAEILNETQTGPLFFNEQNAPGLGAVWFGCSTLAQAHDVKVRPASASLC
jgi:hypothetical protein